MPLVLVRAPTYRRPDLLRRALECLRSQTHEDWICEVRDDCPDGSGRAVVEDLADPRVRYVQNRPQKFLVRNLDDCFRSENPHGADCFFMLEDDNQVRPTFMATGIDILEQAGVAICQINQAIDVVGGAEPGPEQGQGIFDGIFDERVHRPEELRLGLLGGVGISNGAVFWSRRLGRDLAFGMDTIPALDEPLRTVLLDEPIYVCREALAVWTKNEASTTRNLGFDRSRVRRELDLKASQRALRQAVWRATPGDLQRAFLAGGVLRVPLAAREAALGRAGIPVAGARRPTGMGRWVRQVAVRRLGRVHPSVRAVLRDRLPARA